MPDNKLQKQIFVVSGGKGVAGHTMVQSLLIQYPQNKLNVKIIPEVQTIEKIQSVIEKAKAVNGILVHTMVNSNLRQILIDECCKKNVKQIDLMGELASYLENELGLQSVNVPGLYRRINAQYFQRIEAIEFTLNHDDGLNPGHLLKAEIVLTGVSRAGKTPLSVYLSMFGWKVANVPLVKGIHPPEELFEIDSNRVFGLQINANQLISHRHKRLTAMGNVDMSDYVDIQKVRKELQYADLIFEKGGFTKINVTNKPIESSANEILSHITERFGYHDQKRVK
ncbi:MAG: kinase/pyrophosphorylase [Marinilabiliaceae bacterium]|nr:kinase/pyrophosphorylase [Marinilabiliaceae bacterium]